MDRGKFLAVGFIVLTTMLVSFSAIGAGPNLINYQGQLIDLDTGLPVTETAVAMTFRVFDTDTGSSPLWEENQAVDVENGIYNVLLGSGATTFGSFDPDLFSGAGAENRWLEVEVAGEILEPRQRVTSVAFAFSAGLAEDADTLDGLDSTDFAGGVHQHNFSDLSGSAADAQVPNNITIDYAGSAGNADTLDGQHGSDFASSV